MPSNKGGFITLRHNEIRDKTLKLLSEVCKGVRVELSLLKLNWEEEAMNREAKKNNEVRLDFSTREFWLNGQTGFFLCESI